MTQVSSQSGDRPLPDAQAARCGFGQVYQENHAWVFGYLRARLLNGSDAEDLTQEVFLRAYSALERFDRSLGIRPWILGIARNVLREHIRKVHRRKEVGWAELCIELEQMVDQEGLYDDVLAELPYCLAQLGESASQALKWHYFAGEKLDAIAHHLGRTMGAVKVLMVRARQALKRCFARRLEERLAR